MASSSSEQYIAIDEEEMYVVEAILDKVSTSLFSGL